MQHVHVADFVGLEVAPLELFAGLPVIEPDVQLVFARRQGADVDFAAQRDDGARADACTSPWAMRWPLRGSMTCTARE